MLGKGAIALHVSLGHLVYALGIYLLHGLYLVSMVRQNVYWCSLAISGQKHMI